MDDRLARLGTEGSPSSEGREGREGSTGFTTNAVNLGPHHIRATAITVTIGGLDRVDRGGNDGGHETEDDYL